MIGGDPPFALRSATIFAFSSELAVLLNWMMAVRGVSDDSCFVLYAVLTFLCVCHHECWMDR
jgi:hypothetical protein